MGSQCGDHGRGESARFCAYSLTYNRCPLARTTLERPQRDHPLAASPRRPSAVAKLPRGVHESTAPPLLQANVDYLFALLPAFNRAACKRVKVRVWHDPVSGSGWSESLNGSNLLASDSGLGKTPMLNALRQQWGKFEALVGVSTATSNATPESLLQLCANSEHSVFVIMDEKGNKLFELADAYSKTQGANAKTLLELMSGVPQKIQRGGITGGPTPRREGGGRAHRARETPLIR